MIKKLSTICLLLITLPHVVGTCFADTPSGEYSPLFNTQFQTYNLDKRRYLTGDHPSGTMHPTSRWHDWPYNLIVQICTDDHCGTGTFVSPVHILTNKHVAECCGIGNAPQCEVYVQHSEAPYNHYEKTVLAATVIAGGGTATNVKNHCKFTNADIDNGNDWATIELISPNDASIINNYFQKVSGHNINYVHWYEPLNWRENGNRMSVSFRAGFGDLRVLSDQDIAKIKAAYELALDEALAPMITNPNKSDGVDLYQDDTSIWDIYSEDDQKKRKAEAFYRGFLNKYQEIAGKDFLDDCLSDNGLKIIENCDVWPINWQDEESGFWYRYDKHTCSSWGGDSGSALIKYQEQPEIVSLNNAGPYIVPGTNMYSYSTNEYSVPIDQIFTEEVQALLNVARNKKVGDPCEPFHLKQVNATAGYYITDGSNHLYCANLTPCSCAATECMKGFVMAKDEGGRNMGYCVWGGSATSTAANQTINTNTVASNSTSNTAAPALIAAGSTAAVVAATIAGTIAGGKNTARRAYSQQTNIAANGTTAQNIVVTPQNNARAIGANCVADDMPANAERGEYAAVSIKKLDCNGQQCACVATKCKNGYKLVYKQINGKWESMGYCINPKPCTTGQHDTDVIDGIEIIRQHGGKFCK